MPIDDVYSESTGSYLTGSNQVDVPMPQTQPSTTISSIARAVGRGVGQGGAQLFGAAADLTAGLAESGAAGALQQGSAINPALAADADAAINDSVAKARSGHLFESRVGAAAYDLADTLKPDPTKSTAVDQVVQGAVSGLVQLVPPTLLAGPVGGALAGGTSIGMGRAEDLKRQGVDVGTRTAVGAVEGALGGAGAVMPVGGSTLARTAALVAIGGPGLGIAQGAAEKAILRNADYDHLADQIDPLDPVNLAASTLIAGAFGGAHAISTARGARAVAPAAAAPGTPLTDMSVAARKALRYDAPQLDDYATQVAQREGVPPELLLFIKNRGERSNSNQVSSAGAKGVMQFTDATWQQYGQGDRTDPVNSIDAAGRYAKDLMARYNGDPRAVVTEYNGGIEQARAVQRGGAPTDPETVAYLGRWDQYAANHQIDNATFSPTPEQVDAALVSRGQQMVDEANVLPEDDIAVMSAHQDAFETAARQMSDGFMPDVSRVIDQADVQPGAMDAFARQIGESDRGAPVDAAPREAPVEALPEAATPDAAPDVSPAPRAPEQPAAQASSPVEQTLRGVAEVSPETQVHLDATSGSFEGSIGDALKLIDDEHASTIADSKLFEAAANCFISTGI